MTKSWNIGWPMLALTLAVATPGMARPERMPLPGLLNSMEGNVRLDGRSVSARLVGSETLQPSQVLETKNGKAEVLLTPGAFLRIGDDSALRILSASLEDSQVRLMKGKALLRTDTVIKHTLSIMMDDTTTRIDQRGLYGFNARRETIGVLQGKATIYKGDSRFVLKKGHKLHLAGGQPLYAQKLSRQAFESGRLFRWSQLRDKYESKARQSVQRTIAQSGRWHGPGWYWSHFWGFYAYLPSAGTYFSPYYYNPYAWGGWGGDGWGGWGWGDDDDD